MPEQPGQTIFSRFLVRLVALLGTAALLVGVWYYGPGSAAPPSPDQPALKYRPRQDIDSSGYGTVLTHLPSWNADASLEEISQIWEQLGDRLAGAIDRQLARANVNDAEMAIGLLNKAGLCNYEGKASQAYQVLEQARTVVQRNNVLAEDWLFTIIYFQGVTALRRGEDDNCILCRGESSCIIPIAPSAVHTRTLGSRLAIQHFTEYLRQFPDDLEVQWLLNVAHMTLGEHPHQVEHNFLLPLKSFFHSEFDIGKFRDVGHLVGVNRLNQSGGAIMEDFDNDGLLDIVVTNLHPTENMAFYRNKGDGTFEDRTKEAGLIGQLGGLYCVQTDYNNDGHMDIFIPRGAWLPFPIRPTLLRNNGNGTFTDVTKEAGLLDALNSISASWADYDNDGFLDLFVCCEQQPSRLYRNRGDGTFEDVTARAGLSLAATELSEKANRICKGCAWFDYDNDGYPDLFINYFIGVSQLFHNNRDGTFTDVTQSLGIDGPQRGFSCWAWDYDNDGWLDLFATSYDRTLEDVVLGLQGRPHTRHSTKLYRNLGGKGFQDVTREAGLDMVFGAMGSNFGDFDNDGYLDMYLGTGDPGISTLIPNRMFKNVGGKRFAEITASSGTGHLQKGHAVACGDWDRNGTIDIFIEMGGAIPGDKYHNILFQNPGQKNNWLTVKLAGKKTNRPAIGARIKVVTAGEKPLTVHRHVSSGSSFGANPLQQTIGLGKAEQVALLEIHWPTSGTTQVFRDVAINQAIEVTEFAGDYRKLDWKPIPLPK